MSSNVSIGSFEVKMNNEGMYCLNDLHKASGGDENHLPNRWLRADKVKELEVEILSRHKCAIKTSAGRYGGTYVCKELVYAYAMWISAKFNLEVIDVFDKTTRAKTELQSLVDSVRSASKSLSNQINSTSLIITELKGHGSSWGNYGAAIRKAKREAVTEFEQLKSEIQMKLDLL